MRVQALRPGHRPLQSSVVIPSLRRPRVEAIALPPFGPRSATAYASLGGFEGAAALGDFGDLAYPDSELKAWCAKNAAKDYAGRMDICLRCPGIHAFKRCAFPPPWTLAGKGARWAGVVLPSPSDYDFETMFVIGATNPAKLAVMSAVAGLVVPIIGAGVVQAFAFPLSIASALPLVLPVTAARAKKNGEKFEDRLWKVVLQPVVKQLGKYAGALIDYALNGNSALARYAVREIADNLGVKVEAGILLAVAESTQIVDAIRKPALLKEEGTLVSLGDLVIRVADSGTFKGSNVGGTLRVVGETLKTAAAPLSILLKKGTFKQAFDALCKKIIGFTPEELAKLPENARREIVKAKLEVEALPTKVLRALGSAVGDVTNALKRLPYGAGKALQEILDSVAKLSSESLAFAQQLDAIAKAPPTAPPAAPGSGGAPAPPPPATPPAPAPAPAAPPPLPAPAGPPPSLDVNRHYALVARHSGKPLGIAGGSKAVGAALEQQAATGEASQQVRFVPDGAGHFGIVLRHSGLALGVDPGRDERLRQLAPAGVDSQRFRFIAMPGGAYVLAVKHSGRVLDVVNISPESGAPVVEWIYNGGANQQFLIREVAEQPAPTAPSPAPAPRPTPAPAPPSQPGGASTSAPPPTAPTGAAGARPLLPALLTGAAGGLAFGPVGAAVGAGAAYLLSSSTTK